MDRVLDAGCGFGQWALVMAGMNKETHAIDEASSRIDFLSEMIAQGQRQITAKCSKVTCLEYPDGHFDGIFAYSVLFLGDWKRALQEFHRVLRPGGRLFFNFNDVGWYVHLWKNSPNAAGNYDPRRHAAQTFGRTVQYEQGVEEALDGEKIIEQAVCIDQLQLTGFTDIRCGPDGGLTIDPSITVTPFFPELHEGLPGVREILCTKS
jgi:ubiquinone/menaquinone biosynthesis C-methylase UbiE